MDGLAWPALPWWTTAIAPRRRRLTLSPLTYFLSVLYFHAVRPDLDIYTACKTCVLRGSGKCYFQKVTVGSKECSVGKLFRLLHAHTHVRTLFMPAGKKKTFCA